MRLSMKLPNLHKRRKIDLMINLTSKDKIELAFYGADGVPASLIFDADGVLHKKTEHNSPAKHKIVAGSTAVSILAHDGTPKKLVAARSHNVSKEQIFITDFVSWAIQNNIVAINDTVDRSVITPFGALAASWASIELGSVRNSDIFVTITDSEVPITYHLYIPPEGTIIESIVFSKDPSQTIELKAEKSILINLVSVAEPKLTNTFTPPAAKNSKQMDIREFCVFNKRGMKPMRPSDPMIVPQGMAISAMICVIICAALYGTTYQLSSVVSKIPVATKEIKKNLKIVNTEITKASLQTLPSIVDKRRVSVHQVFTLAERLAVILPIAEISWNRKKGVILSAEIDLSNGSQYISDIESKIAANFQECEHSRGTNLGREREITFKINCSI